jgi:hypothetical protein
VVPDLERGLHGTGRNLESLHHKRPYEERNDDGDQNGFDILPEAAALGVIAFGICHFFSFQIPTCLSDTITVSLFRGAPAEPYGSHRAQSYGNNQ